MSSIYAEFTKSRGRQYGSNWSIESIARILRLNAAKGFLRGVDPKLDAAYETACAARHLASHTSVIFTRDNVPWEQLGWHASLCFIGFEEYLPWDEETAEQWLAALYGEDRSRVMSHGSLSAVGQAKGVRHFMLPVARW